VTRRRVAVIGGGIAGLAAARAASEDHDVTVLEAGESPGGKLRTDEFRGRTLDLGPDAFITRNGAAERLCRELGLGEALIAPSSASAAVYARGRLRPFPKGLALGIPTDLRSLASSGIVSPLGTARAALDLLLPGRAGAGLVEDARSGRRDRSVTEVVAPRLGREVLDALVDPLIGGINASDVDELSFVACAPQLGAALAGHRSLMRALRPQPLPAGAPAPGPIFYGLQGGLESLVRALVHDLGGRAVTVRSSSPVSSLSSGPDHRWQVGTGGELLEVDAVILALPAPAAAVLLAAPAPALAAECAAIPYAGVVTVTLAWPADAVPPRQAAALAAIAATRSPARAGSSAAVLPGSGVLIPRTGDRLITAASFTSTKWPRSANPGEIVIRASAGRHGDERALALDDGELIAAVRRELTEVLGITAVPLESRVQRWPASFPQYVRGHLARVARIRALATELPGLALCGAAYDGIGIPACIDSGEAAAAVARRSGAPLSI